MSYYTNNLVSLTNNLENAFFNGFFSNMRGGYKELLAADILEAETGYTILINAPGLKHEDISIDFEDGYLKIQADFSSNKADGGKYLLKERNVAAVSRSFYLGKKLSADNIKAKLENGLLTLAVDFPTEEKISSQKIQIE